MNCPPRGVRIDDKIYLALPDPNQDYDGDYSRAPNDNTFVMQLHRVHPEDIANVGHFHLDNA